MLPKPLGPVAAGGVREEKQHLKRLQEKLLSGQSTFLLLQEVDEGIQEEKRLKGNFDEP